SGTSPLLPAITFILD
nr:RecName: Full=Unknown protein from spot 662 of 2D-PAGE of etiolated coleoptile [Zea mays]